MYSEFHVKSSGCMACNNQVLKNLGKLRGVFSAEIDRIDGTVLVNHTDEVTREEIKKTLESQGFYEDIEQENCQLT